MAAPPTVVRLTKPSDIAMSVSHLLGFVPTESLVVVCLHGKRKRAELAMRLDLLPDEYDGKVVEMMAARVRHQNPREIYVVVFTEAPDVGGDLVRRPLVESLRDAIKVRVQDALLVRAGRWWSYACGDPRCCPPDGGIIDATSPNATSMAAAHALVGDTVLPSRDAVVASLAPIGGLTGLSVAQAAVRQSPLVMSMTTAERIEHVEVVLDDWLDQYADPRITIDHDDAAFLQLACHDVLTRDAVLARCADVDGLDLFCRLLRDVARLAQNTMQAPAWSMFGWAAYCRGSGVEVDVAIGHALAADPTYSLAQLLSECLERQVHPRELRGSSAATGRSAAG